MSDNPAIVALRNRVATNTLTAADQGALTTALDAIAPTFLGPDDSSVVVFSDESEAREWIAALYAILAGNASPMINLASVVTPTEPTVIPSFAPGAGTVLFVADITPNVSGKLRLSVNLTISDSAAGIPAMAIFAVALTAVAGGTLISPGLTLRPTSTTPAFGSGLPIGTAVQAATFTGNDPHDAVLTIASAPINATVGVRLGIIAVVTDSGAQTWNSTLSLSLDELPAE
jgi:hypothetical protein